MSGVGSGVPWRRWLADPPVVAAFALLVGPVVAGRLGYWTPLALPGYLVLALGSAVGSALFPQYQLWVYWFPFVLGSYALAVAAGGGYRVLTSR